MTLDRGHQCGFLTADECAGAETELDIKVESGSENILAEKSVFSCLLDCDLQAVNCDRVLGTHVYVAFIRTDCIAGNCHCFEYGVGVALQNRTVHERTGVALVCVTGNKLLDVATVAGCEFPLQTRGESAAATATQTGIQNTLDHVVRGHFGQHLAEGTIAVHCDVFVDTFRVDYAAVPERNSLLLFIEGSFGKSGCVVHILRLGLVIDQSLHRLSVDKVALHDLVNVVHRHVAVKGSLGIYDHNGTECAETETSGSHDLEFLGKSERFNLGYHSVLDLHAAGRGTSGTAADQDMLFYFTVRTVGMDAMANGNLALHPFSDGGKLR